MIDFQITRRKSSNSHIPLKSLNQSFLNSNKIITKQNIINLNEQHSFQTNQSINLKNIQMNNKIIKKFQQQQKYTTARNFRQSNNIKQHHHVINLRKTSYSFNKKNKSNIINQQENIYENSIFRKTNMLIKNTMKKSVFFDDLTDNDIVLEQRYKIIGQIGKGSFSIVSSAFDKVTHKTIAVKIYDKISNQGWHRLQSIKKQIISLRKVNHQNVVKLYHVIKDKNKLLLFMQNCGRQTLSGLLRKSKCFDQKITKKYFSQIIQGLKHLHSVGICHRDLKPQNILIDEKGDAKIIDFGFSQTGKNYLTSFCGTPPFMCPQIVLKKPYNGMKADVWAAGVLLFLMVNGKLPFRATTQQQLYRLIQTGKYTFSDQNMSENVKRLINRILKVQPDQRATAEQISSDKWFKN